MPADPPDALPTSEAVEPFPAGLPTSEASLVLWRNAPTPLGDVLGWVEALLRAQHAATVAALASGGDAAIRDAVNRLADAEFVCGDYDADDRAAEPGSYKLLVERARDAKHALLALIAARDEQRAAEAARVREEALREGLRAGWLRWREATSDEFGGMLHGHVSGVPNMEAEIDEAIRALREGA